MWLSFMNGKQCDGKRFVIKELFGDNRDAPRIVSLTLLISDMNRHGRTGIMVTLSLITVINWNNFNLGDLTVFPITFNHVSKVFNIEFYTLITKWCMTKNV